MTPAAHERFQVRTPVLIISAAAWTLLVLQPGGMAVAAHHHSLAMPGTKMTSSAHLLTALNSPASLMTGWALMLAAMMAPLLIAPVRHIRDRSFARRRARAIALFAAGYAAIWMPAGFVLLSVALATQQVTPASSLSLALVIVIALVWQFSPIKQRCLNRCHAHAELAAFGLAADLDALRFGLTHGLWCVGSCWALMLLPLLVARGHLLVMAAVTLWLFSERLDQPKPPTWRFRGPNTVARIVIAQTRLRLQRS
jgi:predicted metal-binding membrane protein